VQATSEVAVKSEVEVSEVVKTEGAEGAPDEAAALDDEAATAAWDAYKKQYAEWYEAHGKAAGASPNPPQ
jgi:hypothetical protein